jgi:hypothetical protein
VTLLSAFNHKIMLKKNKEIEGEHNCDLIIIGGGSAAFSAAIRANEIKLNTLCGLRAFKASGQGCRTDIPGFPFSFQRDKSSCTELGLQDDHPAGKRPGQPITTKEIQGYRR